MSILAEPDFCRLGVVCRLYYKLFQEAYGPSSGPLEVVQLQQQVQELNAEMSACSTTDPHCTPSEKYVAVDVDGSDVIIALCTPLMKRVHRYVKHSAELVFMDAADNMDRHNMRVFLLMIYSVAGGLPLGVIITTNEQTATIIRALQLYNTLLDSFSFYKRGTDGPMLFMADDSAAERNALHTVYPKSTLLLCIFHTLQAFWRFLWDSNSAVVKSNRLYLFGLLKRMMYADTEDTLTMQYQELASDSVALANPRIHGHLQSLYDRCVEWAMCCRHDLPVRDNNTNNYCHARSEGQHPVPNKGVQCSATGGLHYTPI